MHEREVLQFRWWMLLLTFALCVVIPSCSKESSKDEASSGGKGEVTASRDGGRKDIILKRMDGTTVRLSEYEGKVVLLNFFATWNEDCKKQVAALNAIQYKYLRGHRLALLGVSMDRGSAAAVRNFVQQHSVTYPVFVNGEQIVNRFGGIRKLPTMYIILSNGSVFTRIEGARPRKFYEDKINVILGRRL